jgi:hypothetical protein
VFAGTIVEVHPAAAAVDVKTSTATVHDVIANAFKALPFLGQTYERDLSTLSREKHRRFPQRATFCLYRLQLVRIGI